MAGAAKKAKSRSQVSVGSSGNGGASLVEDLVFL